MTAAVSSDDDIDDAETEGAAPAKGGSAKSLGLRFQKKFLGMSVKSKGVAKNFIDDTSGMCAVCTQAACAPAPWNDF